MSHSFDRQKGKPRLSTVERQVAQYLAELYREGKIFFLRSPRPTKNKEKVAKEHVL